MRANTEICMNICAKLKQAMAAAAAKFFVSWNFDWEGLNVRFICDGANLTDSIRSGIHTLNFIKFFDGSEHHVRIRKDDEMKHASYLLYDLMHLRGNNAPRPPGLYKWWRTKSTLLR